MKLILDGIAARHPAAPSGTHAIEGIELVIEAGERVALVGPSGAGKTTLLMVASLQLKPSAGTLLVDDVDPWTLAASARHRLRRRLIVAPQAPPLPPRQRVVTSVLAGRLPVQSLGQSLLSWIYPRDAALAHEALDAMGLADKLWLRVDRLSGGERQRVALSRLLVSQAELWAVDEPLSALDPALSDQCLTVLVDAAARHRATLMASLHQIELAVAHFPRLVGMGAGRIVFDRAADTVDASVRQALYATARSKQANAEVVPHVALAELADAELAMPRAG